MPELDDVRASAFRAAQASADVRRRGVLGDLGRDHRECAFLQPRPHPTPFFSTRITRTPRRRRATSWCARCRMR